MPTLPRASSGRSVSHFSFSASDLPASGVAAAALAEAAALAGGLDIVPPVAIAEALGAGDADGFFSSSQPSANVSTRGRTTAQHSCADRVRPEAQVGSWAEATCFEALAQSRAPEHAVWSSGPCVSV